MKNILLFFLIVVYWSGSLAQPVSFPQPTLKMSTLWSNEIDQDNPHADYPRPTMERKDWLSLNGRWYFATSGKDAGVPTDFRKIIIVPFPVESALSGISQTITRENKIWYKRTFFIPEEWSGKLVQLHFGGSDWETTVFINGKEIGKHRGGYDPFSFDISPYLDERGVQEIVISVWDPTDTYHQPRGKQKLDPSGIWYTPVSGIWQTVWIEPVNFTFVDQFKIAPEIDNSSVSIHAIVTNPTPGDSLMASISLKGQPVSDTTFVIDQTVKISIPNQSLWSPEAPNLYDIQLSVLRKGEIIDVVSTYFGMRKIAVAEDSNGIKRLFLNNKPLFQFGLLDQGWWPNGLYTAPNDEALKSDILQTKALGYNVIRKHVKVEPERWYTHCDRLGMLVWQDMPNSDKSAIWKGPSGVDGEEIDREFISEAQYKIEYEAMVDNLFNHPSIVKWIPFNEGWGQFKTLEIYKWADALDTTRLIGGPSGGNYFPVGDTRDYHKYPGPEMPPADPGRALVLGEFGGLGYPVEGHLWQKDKNWGYVNIKSQKDLIAMYIGLVEQLKPMIAKGLSAAIYTQTTDVEGEINGVMTYDRKVVKLNSKKVLKAHQELFQLASEVAQ
jgi:beta-galactosidase/beta-glucuronidase